MNQFSLRLLLAIVLLAGFGFAFVPGWTIVLVSLAPLFACLYVLANRDSAPVAKTIAFALLLPAMIPIYVASIGPVFWLDEEMKLYEYYAPLESVAESTGCITPFQTYAQLWANQEAEALPQQTFIQMQDSSSPPVQFAD